jgi:hypothetical protein
VPERHPEASLTVAGASSPRDVPVESLRSFSEWELTSQAEANVFRRARGDTQLLPERGDLVYETDQTWTVTVTDDDPGSTRAETESRASLSRPGWEVASVGRIVIEGRDAFEVSVELRAFHNGAEVFHRRWEEAIPRVWA